MLISGLVAAKYKPLLVKLGLAMDWTWFSHLMAIYDHQEQNYFFRDGFSGERRTTSVLTDLYQHQRGNIGRVDVQLERADVRKGDCGFR